MNRRDPLVHRCKDPYDGERAATAPGPYLSSNVAGLFETDDPSPERGGRQRAGSVLASEFGFESLHLAEAGRATLRGHPNGSYDPWLDREPPQLRGRYTVTNLSDRRPQDLAS